MKKLLLILFVLVLGGCTQRVASVNNYGQVESIKEVDETTGQSTDLIYDGDWYNILHFYDHARNVDCWIMEGGDGRSGISCLPASEITK